MNERKESQQGKQRVCVCEGGWGGTIRRGPVLKGSDGRKYERISLLAV